LCQGRKNWTYRMSFLIRQTVKKIAEKNEYSTSLSEYIKDYSYLEF